MPQPLTLKPLNPEPKALNPEPGLHARAQVDCNKDGKIDFDEFVAMLCPPKITKRRSNIMPSTSVHKSQSNMQMSSSMTSSR